MGLTLPDGGGSFPSGEDGMSRGARAMTELEHKIEAARKESRAMRESRDIDPPSMPQVERELALVTGVLDSVESAVARLVVKVEPICGVAPEYMEVEKRGDDWPVTAEIAGQLRGLYNRLQRIESTLGVTTARVEV